MVYFYDPLFGNLLVYGAVLLITLFIYFTFLKNRVKKYGCVPIVGLITGLFIIVLVILGLPISSLLFQLQKQIALPYVQEAVNIQCNTTEINVSDGEFITSSRISWESPSDDYTCHYNMREWICQCADD